MIFSDTYTDAYDTLNDTLLPLHAGVVQVVQVVQVLDALLDSNSLAALQ
jgi:hypothetical protein